MGNNASNSHDPHDVEDHELHTGHFVIHFIGVADIPVTEVSSECRIFIRAYLGMPTTEDSGEFTKTSITITTAVKAVIKADIIWHSYRDFCTTPQPNSFLCIELVNSQDNEVIGSANIPVTSLDDEEIKNFKFDYQKYKYTRSSISLRRLYINTAPPKYKTIFLVRHGESKWNKAQSQGNIGGMLNRDHALTDEGVSQAAELNMKWKKYNEIISITDQLGPLVDRPSEKDWEPFTKSADEFESFPSPPSCPPVVDNLIDLSSTQDSPHPPTTSIIEGGSNIPTSESFSSSSDFPFDMSPPKLPGSHITPRSPPALPSPARVTQSPTSPTSPHTPVSPPTPVSFSSSQAFEPPRSPYHHADGASSGSQSGSPSKSIYQFDGALGLGSGNGSGNGSGSGNSLAASPGRPLAGGNRTYTEESDLIELDTEPDTPIMDGKSPNKSYVRPPLPTPDLYRNDSVEYSEYHPSEDIGISSEAIFARNSNSQSIHSHDILGASASHTQESSDSNSHFHNVGRFNSSDEAVEARRIEYIRMFLSADAVFSSPLTRAIETAFVVMENHTAIENRGLTLFSAIREVKRLGGLDSVGLVFGDDIENRVRDELSSKLGKHRAEETMLQSLNYNDCNQPWWTSISSYETDAEQQDRIREFISFTRYSDVRTPVYVGHSLFFRAFYAKRISKMLSNNRPELAQNMSKYRLSNATLMALTLQFYDKPGGDAIILDADLIFGGGFHGGNYDEDENGSSTGSTAATNSTSPEIISSSFERIDINKIPAKIAGFKSEISSRTKKFFKDLNLN